MTEENVNPATEADERPHEEAVNEVPSKEDAAPEPEQSEEDKNLMEIPFEVKQVSKIYDQFIEDTRDRLISDIEERFVYIALAALFSGQTLETKITFEVDENGDFDGIGIDVNQTKDAMTKLFAADAQTLLNAITPHIVRDINAAKEKREALYDHPLHHVLETLKEVMDK